MTEDFLKTQEVPELEPKTNQENMKSLEFNIDDLNIEISPEKQEENK